MLNNFESKIDEIYNLIIEPIDIIYKVVAINKFKDSLNIGRLETLGQYYSNNIKDKKEKGAVYTPVQISEFIIKNTITSEEIIENPFIKIADPSCGCGNLIIPCFKYVRNIYMENLDKINKKFNLYLNEENIDKHIIQNNLYGFDIDGVALKILLIDLFSIGKYIKSDNFLNNDFLLVDDSNKYDVFIGNPPYIGQKTVDKEYSKKIKTLYREIFKDKGDISYCFFGASLNRLVKGGKLSFITSRYFLESPSGEILRKTLKEFCEINKIVDFYGIRPFKGVGIDPVIIFLKLGGVSENIEIIKPLIGKEKYFLNSILYNEKNDIQQFNINKNLLNNKGWVLRGEDERKIINKIEEKCFTSLGNICNSYQGVITGCDKAFVVNSSVIKKENIEKKLIRPWIKSSFIKKGYVEREDSFLIYSDMISDENEFSQAILHIEKFKHKLVQRRECVNGKRLWYQLQWGRVQNIFEGEKIVFPFKSNKNRFSLDYGSYFSADVYCLVIKDNTPFTYNFLINLLNSKLYEYYFKSFAKKLGEDQYEYYPNNLMKLCIPTMIELNENIDAQLYKYFNLSKEEIDIVEQYVKI